MSRAPGTFRPRRPLLLAAAAAGIWACTEFPTDPGVPVALSFLRLPAPSVVAGDTLRDSTGAAVQVEAVALDALGDTVDVAAIEFRSGDGRLFVVTPERYIVGGAPYYVPVAGSDDSTRIDSARVLAAAGGVQDGIMLVVTRRPASMTRTSPERDTVVMTPISAFVDSLGASLRVQLLSVGDSAVYSHRVSYGILHDGVPVEQDTTSPFTLRASRAGILSAEDTTDAEGFAERWVRIDRRRLPCPADQRPDSIVVVATVRPDPVTVLSTSATIVIDTAGFTTTGCGP